MIPIAGSVLLLMLGMALPLFAQPGSSPRFEVAAIKPTPPDQWNGSSGGTEGKGSYEMHNRTLKRYIMGAYNLGPNQIVGGPPWLDSDRFDIYAKAEQPIDEDDVFMAMLRTLLAERCKLAIRREFRPIHAYVLEVAKGGPKLGKVADPTATPITNNAPGRIDAKSITLKRFAEVLSRQMDLPVLDFTGLEGVFNVKLEWSPERDERARPGQLTPMANLPSIFAAIQELGLRLQARTTPVEMLVIEHLEKPSEN